MKNIKLPWRYLVLIILAGESIFFLPYVLCRIFRPTVLEVFQINNIQLGVCFSVYGFVAIGSYLLGGPMIGYFLENFEDKAGYQYVFLILAGFSFIGGIASWKYHKLYK